MSNLIWRLPKSDRYCGLSNNKITTMEVQASSTAYLMCFAELLPNTTYTIQRIDASSLMRWGIGNKHNDYYFSAVKLDRCFTSGDFPDDSLPHTFTTKGNESFICIYLSNSSETGIRVQLNQGTTIEPYSTPEIMPVRYYKWHIKSDYPINMVSPDIIDILAEPVAKNYWTLKCTDDGYPVRSAFMKDVAHCLPVKAEEETEMGVME